VSGRPFFVPMIRIVLLFGALGPAIGGAMFIPLSLAFEAPKGVGVLAVFGLMALVLGHAVGWILVYAFGLGPAAATGFLFSLWDAAAPARAPRALAALILGGLIAGGFLSRLNPVGQHVQIMLMSIMSGIEGNLGAVEMKFGPHVDPGPVMVRVIVATARSFVVCGAVAGFVSAFVANLLGLTMRPDFAVSAPLSTPGERA
jgi:hypothetical protein